MSTSNKAKTPRSSDTSSVPRQAADLRSPRNGRADVSSPGAGNKNEGEPSSTAPRSQAEFFELATRLFRAGKFQEARAVFTEARQGSDRAMALNAEQHVRMCDRRLAKGSVVLTTPDEHYNYAVALINSRELALARQHLQAALTQDRQADHLYYAVALCLALGGDLQGAYENLKRAIELQPKNRIAARQDADFAGLVDRPPLDRLVYPERKTPS